MSTRAQLWNQLKKKYAQVGKLTQVVRQDRYKLQWPRFNVAEAKTELKRLNDFTKNKVFDLKSALKSEIKSKVKPMKIKKFFNGKINNLTDIKTNDILDNLNLVTIPDNKRLQFSFIRNGERVFKTIKNLREIKKHMSSIQKNNIIDLSGDASDTEALVYLIQNNDDIELEWIHKGKSNNNNHGGYFQYYHKLHTIDLTDYQIYTENQESDQTNCFIYALDKHNVLTENELNTIKLRITEETLNIKKIQRIAAEFDLNIKINILNEDDKIDHNTYNYNKTSKRIINLGLVGKHYFINNDTILSKTSIVCYEEVKNHKLFPTIDKVGDKYRKARRSLSSFDVVKYLYRNKSTLLTPITLFNVQIENEQKLLEYTELRAPINNKESPQLNEFRELKYKISPIFKSSKKIKEDPNTLYEIVFIDFETFQDNTLGYHIPFCVNKQSYTKNFEFIENKTFYGLDCAKQLLDSLNTHSVLIAHNAGFEYKMLIDHLYKIKNVIQTGSMLKQAEFVYKFKQIILKDSYAMISTKLSNFPKMMNLNIKDKGKYPYSLINKNNFNSFIAIDEALKNIDGDQSDKDQFLTECNQINAIENDLLDIKKITIDYCENDVEILAKGYLKFRDLILEACDMDILNLISSAQLSDKFLIKRGCYDQCFDISGISEDFIRRCIVGGRCMTSDNIKHHIKAEIADSDANSLYPSAMFSMNGFIKGLPKVLTQDNIENFESFKSTIDEYYIKILVTKIGKERSFPLLSIVDDKTKVRNFTNDIVGQYFYVDRVSLEDVIEFQQIEYEIIQGYYFNEGYNKTINDTIKELYDLRTLYKKVGNPIEQVYKLIMNSAYGKTIQKPIKKNDKFIKGNMEVQHKFIYKNYNHIDTYTQINETLWHYKMNKSVNEHFSRVHIGVNILSMSKRIMNEVICLAEDNDIKVYYQDTDSLHLDFNKTKDLANLYKNKYNKELYGKYLLQFSSDFDVKEKNISPKYEVRASESYFIGKKCYIDKLKFKDSNNKIKYEYHCRMKGIPNILIKNKMDTYKKLYKGKSIEFDLSSVIKLQNNSNYRISNVQPGEFKRTIQYNDFNNELDSDLDSDFDEY